MCSPEGWSAAATSFATVVRTSSVGEMSAVFEFVAAEDAVFCADSFVAVVIHVTTATMVARMIATGIGLALIRCRASWVANRRWFVRLIMSDTLTILRFGLQQ